MAGAREADLGRIHVAVPVRSLAGGKARLGGALDAEERETLIVGMLRHELQVLAEWGGAEAIHVVSGDPTILAVAADGGALPLAEPPTSDGDGHGADGRLNASVFAAQRAAVAAGATALLVIPADLPSLDTDAVADLAGVADATLAAGSGRPIVVLAAADARGGTNAMLLSPPDAIRPHFGRSSLEAHVRAAAAVDASVQIVVYAAFGVDLDEPADLERIGAARIHALMDLGARAMRATGVEL